MIDPREPQGLAARPAGGRARAAARHPGLPGGAPHARRGDPALPHRRPRDHAARAAAARLRRGDGRVLDLPALRGLPVEHGPDPRPDGGAGPVRPARGRRPSDGSSRGCARRWWPGCGRCAEARVWPPETLREAVAARVRPAAPRPDAAAVARAVARAGGGAVRSIVFFGSRKTQSAAGRLQRLRPLRRGRPPTRRSTARCGRRAACGTRPALGAGLNAWLPPNQVSVPVTLDGRHARAGQVRGGQRGRPPARRPRALRKDHFMAGRLFQPTEILYAAGRRARSEAALDARGVARTRLTYDWVRPWLPDALRRRGLLPHAAARVLRGGDPAGAGGPRGRALAAHRRTTCGRSTALLLEALAARGRSARSRLPACTRWPGPPPPASACAAGSTSGGRWCGPPRAGRSTS